MTTFVDMRHAIVLITGRSKWESPEEVIEATVRQRSVWCTIRATTVVSMADQERCPIFPSMLKAYCSHCQGTARGTPGNPKFSLKESIYNGFPVVEVLRDGAAIHPWDEHFRFGRRKAQMLLTCIDVLRDFWKSNGDENDRFVPSIIENRTHRLRVRVFVEKHPDFER